MFHFKSILDFQWESNCDVTHTHTGLYAFSYICTHNTEMYICTYIHMHTYEHTCKLQSIT